MRWIKSLTSRVEDDDVRRALAKLFSKAKPSALFTVSDLARSTHAERMDVLIAALADLTRDRVVDQVFRVESPKNRGGIKDFESIESVPDMIYDWRQDQEISVDPRMVRLFFRKHDEATGSGRLNPSSR